MNNKSRKCRGNIAHENEKESSIKAQEKEIKGMRSIVRYCKKTFYSYQTEYLAIRL